MGRSRHYLRKKRTAYSRAHKEIAKRHHTKRFIEDILNEVITAAVTMEENTICRSLVMEIIEASVQEAEQKRQAEALISEAEQEESDISKLDEYDFTWGSVDEYNRICEEELEIERVAEANILSGYRIVDINYLMQQSITLQYNHSKKCTGGRLEFIEEKRKGLTSSFKYKCNICSGERWIHTENPMNEKVNKAAVWGTVSTGSTYAHMREFLSVLDIPAMSKQMFSDTQRNLSYIWNESFWEDMEASGKEEYQIALERGHFDEYGVPFITVCLDGGWSKRSYGHSYNAASGVAVIIGKATGKLLYLGVRNKYCCICARAENKGEPVGNHLCFKNWTGSSAAMEADIIVEGFNRSIEMHGVKYKKFIADGDSSVYSQIRRKVTYGNEVEKIECTNHCIKNYSKHLYTIAKDTKNISLEARKLLTKETIDKLVKTAQKAIYTNAHGDVDKLREDLRNSVSHVFGHHIKCVPSLCDNVGEITSNKYITLNMSGAHHHIYAALNFLIAKANMLIDNQTNNRAELFMSILARFNMGKRLNLIQRDSFQIRATLSGLSYNQGQSWHSSSWKKCFEESPGKNMKSFIKKKEQENLRKKRYMNSKPPVAKKLKFLEGNKDCSSKNQSKDYGSNSAEIVISETELKSLVEDIIEELTITEEQFLEIPLRTIGQFDNPVYRSERSKRLTASNFGKVVKRRPTTSCDALVKYILNDDKFYSPAMEYGKRNEIIAIRKFEEKTGLSVHPSGLFVDKEYGFLGASPDGIVSEEEIVEVKCSLKVANLNLTLEEAVKQNKVAFLSVTTNGTIQLKTSHDYYYQIQGQLAISRRKLCYFVVYSGDKNDIFIQAVLYDGNFWHNDMLPKLVTFYRECLAPEIILNRRVSGLKCKDPPSIIEAQAKKKKMQKDSE